MASPALADGKLLALTHPECLGTDAHNYRRWPAQALTYAAHAPVAQTARNKSWASAANRRAFRKLPTYPIFRCGRTACVVLLSVAPVRRAARQRQVRCNPIECSVAAIAGRTRVPSKYRGTTRCAWGALQCR